MYYMVQVYKSSLSNILPWWMSAQLTVEPKLLPAERTWVIRERSDIGVEVMCSWCGFLRSCGHLEANIPVCVMPHTFFITLRLL